MVNCLLKQSEIWFGDDTLELSYVMASFPALGSDFPSIALIVLHSLIGSELWYNVSSNCIHVCLQCSFVVLMRSSIICCRAGEVDFSRFEVISSFPISLLGLALY